MPRQLADVMAEYAQHEGSRTPTVFTRDASGHVRAHEFQEPDDESAIRRVQGIVADSAAAVTGLLLPAHEPERVLVTATDGATHIAAQAAVGEAGLGEWQELPPGDPTATFVVNLLRQALGADTLTRRAGALDEVAMFRRALDGFLQRVDADGYLAARGDRLEGDRLGLVELARDALALASSYGRADRELDEGVVLKRVPTPADPT
jgi:hypothetical protein